MAKLYEVSLQQLTLLYIILPLILTFNDRNKPGFNRIVSLGVLS